MSISLALAQSDIFYFFIKIKLIERSSYLRREKKKHAYSGATLAGCAVPTLINLFRRGSDQLGPSEGLRYSLRLLQCFMECKSRVKVAFWLMGRP